MQKRIIRTCVLLAGALASTITLSAQRTEPAARNKMETNVAVLFNLERVQVAQTGSPSFWMKGGAIEASASFWKGLGLVGYVSGGNASNIANGVSFSKRTFMGGPRYTVRQRRTSIFGESLFGATRAFGSVFPGTNGVTSAAEAFSLQISGGVDVSMTEHFNIRALEAGWVHTNLPNNAANSQNDLQLAFGISWRR